MARTAEYSVQSRQGGHLPTRKPRSCSGLIVIPGVDVDPVLGFERLYRLYPGPAWQCLESNYSGRIGLGSANLTKIQNNCFFRAVYGFRRLIA